MCMPLIALRTHVYAPYSTAHTRVWPLQHWAHTCMPLIALRTHVYAPYSTAHTCVPTSCWDFLMIAKGAFPNSTAQPNQGMRPDFIGGQFGALLWFKQTSTRPTPSRSSMIAAMTTVSHIARCTQQDQTDTQLLQRTKKVVLQLRFSTLHAPRKVHTYVYAGIQPRKQARLMQRYTAYVVVCSVHPLLGLQVLEVVDAVK